MCRAGPVIDECRCASSSSPSRPVWSSPTPMISATHGCMTSSRQVLQRRRRAAILCLDGALRPPRTSGWGYEVKLEVLVDPEHEDYGWSTSGWGIGTRSASTSTRSTSACGCAFPSARRGGRDADADARSAALVCATLMNAAHRLGGCSRLCAAPHATRPLVQVGSDNVLPNADLAAGLEGWGASW